MRDVPFVNTCYLLTICVISARNPRPSRSRCAVCRNVEETRDLKEAAESSDLPPAKSAIPFNFHREIENPRVRFDTADRARLAKFWTKLRNSELMPSFSEG